MYITSQKGPTVPTTHLNRSIFHKYLLHLNFTKFFKVTRQWTRIYKKPRCNICSVKPHSHTELRWSPRFNFFFKKNSVLCIFKDHFQVRSVKYTHRMSSGYNWRKWGLSDIDVQQEFRSLSMEQDGCRKLSTKTAAEELMIRRGIYKPAKSCRRKSWWKVNYPWKKRSPEVDM